MSKKAEDKAMYAWAVYEYREHPKGLYHTCFVDGYQQGYNQAEKDCALTWKDVQAIFRIADNYESELNRPKYLTQDYCEEVLHRFNKNKEE